MALSLHDIDIVVISLKRRADRRKVINAALKREDLEFHFFDALTPSQVPKPVKNWRYSPEMYASQQSHVAVLAAGKKPLLVFEDDADIPIGFAETLSKLLAELPDSWLVLRLGGEHVRPPKKISDTMVRCRGAMYPHAYLARHPEELSRYANKSMVDWDTNFMLYDGRYGQTYSPIPWLVNTTGSKSDIPGSVPIGTRTKAGFAYDPTTCLRIEIQEPGSAPRLNAAHKFEAPSPD